MHSAHLGSLCPLPSPPKVGKMSWMQGSPNLFLTNVEVSQKNVWLTKVCFPKINDCQKSFPEEKSSVRKSFFPKFVGAGRRNGTEAEGWSGVEAPRADKLWKKKLFWTELFLLENFFNNDLILEKQNFCERNFFGSLRRWSRKRLGENFVQPIFSAFHW